ncbi:hypothetical protein F2Q69_00005651 [Brassica cretica]|uniref:Uncharacterized protein n=1 Tax=Brassica cretica TaxID=69181 RepID=A0A8S9PCW9_BRACR|nr:hypothetical protein F2Q69_00005651 [Brassica cretica]
MDPPDKDPDPDTLKLPGYPIRPRPIVMCFNWKKRSLSLLFWWVLSFFDEQSGLWRFSGSLVYGESVKCRGVTRLWRALVSRVFMCWLLWSHLAMRLESCFYRGVGDHSLVLRVGSWRRPVVGTGGGNPQIG